MYSNKIEVHLNTNKDTISSTSQIETWSMSITAKTCSICCEDYNKSTKKAISCPSCPFECCRGCIRTYHLGSKDEPHCMSCKNSWNKDTFTNATLKSFVNGEYKKHKELILFESLVSKLPEAMPAVQNHLECRELEKQEKEIT